MKPDGEYSNRPVSIGRHPTNVSEHYLELIYNPTHCPGTKPGNDSSISSSRTATGMQITFEGVLQTSLNLRVWNDVPGAISPHSVPFASSARGFFRARR